MRVRRPGRGEQRGVEIATLQRDPQLAPLLPRHAQLVQAAPKRLAGLPQTAIVMQRPGEGQQQLGTRDPRADQPHRRLQMLHGPAPTGDRLGVPQFREHGRTDLRRRRLPQGPLQVLNRGVRRRRLKRTACGRPQGLHHLGIPTRRRQQQVRAHPLDGRPRGNAQPRRAGVQLAAAPQRNRPVDRRPQQRVVEPERVPRGQHVRPHQLVHRHTRRRRIDLRERRGQRYGTPSSNTATASASTVAGAGIAARRLRMNRSSLRAATAAASPTSSTSIVAPGPSTARRSSRSCNGLPPVSCPQRRHTSGDADGHRSRTSRSTATALSGRSRSTRVAGSAATTPNTPSASPSDGRAPITRPTGRSAIRGCKWARNRRDGSSAQCASSTTSTVGRRSPSRTTSQYSACRIPNPASPAAEPATPPGSPSRTARAGATGPSSTPTKP